MSFKIFEILTLVSFSNAQFKVFIFANYLSTPLLYPICMYSIPIRSTFWQTFNLPHKKNERIFGKEQRN